MCIFCIQCIQSLNLVAGECVEINLDSPIIKYEIINNQYDLEGLSVVIDNSNAIICTAINYKPDTFTIIFYGEKSIIQRVRSGGSSNGKYIRIDKAVLQNYTNCEEGSIVCKDNELWKCIDGEWKLDVVCYRCEVNECAEEEIEDIVEEETNNDILLAVLILFALLGGALLVKLIIILKGGKVK